MANVFKEIIILKDELLSTKNHLPREDVNGIASVDLKLNLVYEIEKYINGYKWKGDLKDKMNTYLEYNCSAKVLCDKYTMTVNAVELCIHRASKTIWGKIGQSTLKLIREGAIEDARDLFYYRSGKYKLKDYLLTELGDSLPKEGKYITIRLSDCLKELTFLYHYSKVGYEKAFNNIDPVKLSYLRYILEEDSPKLAYNRTLLHKLLTEGNYKLVIGEIKEEGL